MRSAIGFQHDSLVSRFNVLTPMLYGQVSSSTLPQTCAVEASMSLLPVAALLSKVAANCAYEMSAFPRIPSITVSSFGYDGLIGPFNWYGLNRTANFACDQVSNRSPVVINSTIPIVDSSTLKFTVQTISMEQCLS